MSEHTTFNIYCMSYKRANKILTKHMFEYCTYVVRSEEETVYREAGVEDILCIPTGEVFSFMSTLFWVIDNTPEDVIFIADDDIENFYYLLDDSTELVLSDGTPDKEMITSEVERIAQLLVDLDIGLAFDKPNLTPYTYTGEFSFLGMPGHMRWINKKAFKAQYPNASSTTMGDKAASDVDVMLQELLKNRIILQPQYIRVKSPMDVNAGAFRTRKTHLDVVEELKMKWGKYFDYNYKRNIAKIKVDR